MAQKSELSLSVMRIGEKNGRIFNIERYAIYVTRNWFIFYSFSFVRRERMNYP